MPPKAGTTRKGARQQQQQQGQEAQAPEQTQEQTQGAHGAHGVFSSFRVLDGAAAKKIAFEVTDLEVGVVNAIRRAAISDVPSVAFHHEPTLESFPASGVQVRKNTSPLHNEMLGARLALVPVCLDENQIDDAFGTPGPTPLTFELKKKNTGRDMALVTTADLRRELQPERDAWTDAVFPPCPVTGDHILLTKLKPNPYGRGDGDEVDVRCAASLRTGAEHARWSPVSLCYFTNKLDPVAGERAFGDRVRAARAGGDERDVALLRREFDALDARRHFHVDPQTGEANRFEFRVESECGMRAASIVFMALQALQARVRSVRVAIEGRDAAKVSAISPSAPLPRAATALAAPSPAPPDGLHHLVVMGEGHTLGNLVQSMVFTRNCRGVPEGERAVRSIGYEQPHPLEDCIIFRVRLADAGGSVEAFMIDSLLYVEGRLRDLAADWARASGLDRAGVRVVDRFLAVMQAPPAADPTPPGAREA